MRKEFLIIAGFCLIVGIGLTAEVVDWNQNDYGPKTRKQTIYLAIFFISSSAILSTIGLYLKDKKIDKSKPIRVYCSYCDIENQIDATECKKCNLSSYLEVEFE